MIAVVLLAHIGGISVEEVLAAWPAPMGTALVVALASLAARLRNRR